MENNNYKIYMHLFPNGKSYIGLTGLDVKERWMYQGSGYKDQSLMYRAINKYGWDNIQHIILEDDLSFADANILEKCYIAMYESNNRDFGYNISRGGNGSGMHSEESKKLMSAQRKGKKKSSETKQNMSDAFTGRVRPLEFKKYLSKIKKGKPSKLDKSAYMTPVVQIDLSNRIIVATYNSIHDAAAQTGISASHICECCKFRRKQDGGFKWAYKSFIDEGGDPFSVKIDYKKRKIIRSVYSVDRHTGNIIKEYRSIREAAKAMSVSEGSISRSIHSDHCTSCGFRWYFSEEYIPKEATI